MTCPELEVEYLFVDAVFEALRRHGAKEALLVAWCIDSDGRKHLLHLGVGNKESEACWTEFFRTMLDRGLRMPTTITSDGAPGLVKAIGVCFPAAIRIRCWFHRLANIRAKLPDESASEVMAHLYAVRDAPTLDAARAAADRLINTFDASVPGRGRVLPKTTSTRCWPSTGSRSDTVSEYGPRTWPNARSSKNAAAPRSSADSATNARR